MTDKPSEAMIEALAREQYRWQMGETGRQFDDLPAQQRNARLVQARHWVERFTAIASLTTKDRETDREALLRKVEEIASAWAFAHDIDGAARNDLFKRIAEGMRG